MLCDLDGVVWLAHRAIPGSREAVAELRAAGHRVLFVTNNSASLLAEQETALARLGIPAAGDVLTSAQAAARLVSPGERVLVCGGPGLVEAVGSRGADVVAGDASADAVVVGFHRDFDYDGLRRAVTAVLRGARLIGSNDDPTYPTPSGPIPGGGAILAAVATAAGVEPVVAGKPYQPMADLVAAELGIAELPGAVMVGDRPSTDGRFARRLGCRFALVWSGVSAPADDLDPLPDLVGDDLAAVARQLIAAARTQG